MNNNDFLQGLLTGTDTGGYKNGFQDGYEKGVSERNRKKVTIETYSEDDLMSENLRVKVDDKVIANFNSQMDCPEDFSLSRMGVGVSIARIIEALGGEVEAVRFFNEDAWYDGK